MRALALLMADDLRRSGVTRRRERLSRFAEVSSGGGGLSADLTSQQQRNPAANVPASRIEEREFTDGMKIIGTIAAGMPAQKLTTSGMFLATSRNRGKES